MVELACHLTQALLRPTDRLGAPCGRQEANELLRSIFGFSEPSLEQAWSLLLEFDALMGQPPHPQCPFGPCLGDPLGRQAVEMIQRCFSEMTHLIDSATLGKPCDLRRSSIERRHQRAMADLASMGFSPERARALGTHGFVDSCMDSLQECSGFATANHIEPLAKLCRCDPSFLPRLGSNDILAELAVGSLGAWLYHEATNLDAPKDVFFALPAFRRGGAEGAPPILIWASRLCANLNDQWIAGQGPLLDSSLGGRLLALCSVLDQAPRPDLAPASSRQRLRAELEAQALASSCPEAASPRRREAL